MLFLNPRFCFPYKPEFEEKVSRMHSNITKFEESSLRTLESEAERPEVVQMREMIDAARAKFHQIKAKRRK